MGRTDFPMAPFVLAFVLGKNAEIHLRRAIMLAVVTSFQRYLHHCH